MHSTNTCLELWRHRWNPPTDPHAALDLSWLPFCCTSMITDESSVTMTAHEGQDAPQIKLKGEQGLQDVPPPPQKYCCIVLRQDTVLLWRLPLLLFNCLLKKKKKKQTLEVWGKYLHISLSVVGKLYCTFFLAGQHPSDSRFSAQKEGDERRQQSSQEEQRNQSVGTNQSAGPAHVGLQQSWVGLCGNTQAGC